MTEADSLYAQGALVAPPGRNATTGYVQVLSLAPQNSIARAKLSKIVGQVAVDSQQLMLHQQFNLAHQTIDRLAAAIPANASQFVQADALDRWHVVDLLLRADALMQKYQIAEPEQENAVALLHEALRIDPKNPVGDEMLAKALGMLAETKQRQLVDAPEARAPTSG